MSNSGAVARREVERGPLDLIAPRLVASGEPAVWLGGVPTRHDVEELAFAHVDDLGRPQLVTEPAHPGEQGLIEAERTHRADAGGVIDRLLDDRDDRVHHGVPAAAQIASDLGDHSTVAADLQRRPLCRPRRQHASRCRNVAVVVGPAATATSAAPSLLAPRQPSGPAEDET